MRLAAFPQVLHEPLIDEDPVFITTCTERELRKRKKRKFSLWVRQCSSTGFICQVSAQRWRISPKNVSTAPRCYITLFLMRKTPKIIHLSKIFCYSVATNKAILHNSLIFVNTNKLDYREVHYQMESIKYHLQSQQRKRKPRPLNIIALFSWSVPVRENKCFAPRE